MPVLGLVGSSCEDSSFFPSKIGGTPSWLFNKPLSADSVRCSVCSKISKFLLQFYSPEDEISDAFHKAVYVFVCEACSFYSSFRIGFREDFISSSASPGCCVCNLKADFQCSACKKSFFCSKEHQLLNPCCPHEKSLSFPLLPIESLEIESESEDEVEEEIILDNRPPIENDPFHVTLACSPHQVFRYLRYSEEKPLLPKNTPLPSMAFNCDSCDAIMEIEFQLTPQLLHFCQIDNDWSTILCFTCPRECKPGEFHQNKLYKI